jgi:hypothetical protein
MALIVCEFFDPEKNWCACCADNPKVCPFDTLMKNPPASRCPLRSDERNPIPITNGGEKGEARDCNG